MIDGKLVIAIDFDGTIATQSFPEVGRLIHGADTVIRKLHKQGHRILINTCRSGKMEGLAQDFLDKHEIPYELINSNLPELITLYKQDCRKMSADVYIDDKNLYGLPSWDEIYIMLQELHDELLEKKKLEETVTILKLTGLFRDGGSQAYVDENGKQYWRDNGFGHHERGSKLYEGHPNVQGRITPAIGTFKLTGREDLEQLLIQY